jgi:hypothetical protein
MANENNLKRDHAVSILLRHQQQCIRHCLQQIRNGDREWRLQLATSLRVLLVDEEHPVLLEAAERHGVPLIVYGPERHGCNGEIWGISFGLAAIKPSGAASTAYGLREYLDVPVGMLGPAAHTPRQIIKWVANKDGGAHFDYKKPATLKELQAPSVLQIRTHDWQTGKTSTRPWPHDESLTLLLQLGGCVDHWITELLRSASTDSDTSSGQRAAEKRS